MVRKILVILFLLFAVSTPIHASERVAGDSAVLQFYTRGPVSQKVSYEDKIQDLNVKKKAIKSVLERSNSPMVGEIDTFLKTCEDYSYDCYFLPAITGLESGFGNHILPGSYNPFGWNGGYFSFNDWSHGIETVAAGIKERYTNAGLLTVEQIGTRYASSPTWAVRVRGFIATFEKEEQKNKLYFADSELQL